MSDLGLEQGLEIRRAGLFSRHRVREQCALSGLSAGPLRGRHASPRRCVRGLSRI